MKGKAPPPFSLPARYKYAGETLAGGQGTVFICKDSSLERDVAIKALHKVANYPALLKEVAARGKIKSKHVAEIYEVLIDTGGMPIAVVLEFIPGDPLSNKKTIPATLSGRLLLLYQLACGLNDIHSANVIHRDIKPENVKVDSSGVLRIFDLGISNIDADFASTAGAAGTAIYRAPELYKTLPAAVTIAADIYAFGVTAWFVLSSTFPPQLLELPPQTSGPAPSIATVIPGLGVAGSLIDRALSRNPDLRPTAGELKDALTSVLMEGKQRGVFTYGLQIWELTEAGKVTSLKVGALGSIRIAYSGSAFVVREVTGDVYVNNVQIGVGHVLPESCVLTFGATSLGSGRAFVPFDSSRPEIVL